MANIQLFKVIPISNIADIVYDYFNETKNNYRLVLNQYSSIFSWSETNTIFDFGKGLQRKHSTLNCVFVYNYRDLNNINNHNALQDKHQQKWNVNHKNATTDIYNHKRGQVTILPPPYYYSL